MLITRSGFFYKLGMVLVLCSFADGHEKTIISDSPSNRVLLVKESNSLIILNTSLKSEVKISVKILKNKKAVVTISNTSLKDVFIPYLPAISGNWSPYACLGLEEMNTKTRSFSTISCGHLVTGMNLLQSGKSFKYLIGVPRRGVYRLNFNYLVDRQLVEKLNKIMDLDENQRKEIADKARASAISVISRTFSL